MVAVKEATTAATVAIVVAEAVATDPSKASINQSVESE